MMVDSSLAYMAAVYAEHPRPSSYENRCLLQELGQILVLFSPPLNKSFDTIHQELNVKKLIVAEICNSYRMTLVFMTGSYDIVLDTLVLLYSLLIAVVYFPVLIFCLHSCHLLCKRGILRERQHYGWDFHILDFFMGNVSGCGVVDLVPLPACFLCLLL